MACLKGMQLKKKSFVQKIKIEWKQGSFLGLGGDVSQDYNVYEYKSPNGAVVPVFIQKGWDAPDTLTINNELQYGMAEGVFYLVFHDKSQTPFQHRFIQTIPQQALYTANNFLKQVTKGTLDLSWSFGEYLHDFWLCFVLMVFTRAVLSLITLLI